MTTTRWTTECQGCRRERDVETRIDHAAKVLCDECAAKPHKPPSADGLLDDTARPERRRSDAIATSGSSWAPVDLAVVVAGVMDGKVVGPVPTMLQRVDGVALVYPGELHQIAGEPEGGKTWIALAAAAVELRAGRRVLFLDFEDTAPSVVGRLLALGVDGVEILDGLTYVRPETMLIPEDLRVLLDGPAFGLAVLDGMTEAYALLGLDYSSNQDIPAFLAKLARPIAGSGAAVLLLDHVAKTKETRGRFAVGGGHKLAGVACAYGVDVVTAPSRTTAGLVKLIVHKDRHGHVRGHAEGGVIALVKIEPEDNGARVRVTIDPPDPAGAAFRPTVLMERLSRFLEANPGAGVKQIRQSVKGNHEAKDKGLELLIAEGWVAREPDGPAKRHRVVREYREANDPSPGAHRA